MAYKVDIVDRVVDKLGALLCAELDRGASLYGGPHRYGHCAECSPYVSSCAALDGNAYLDSIALIQVAH